MYPRWLLLALALLSGCTPFLRQVRGERPEVPRAAEAIAVVWAAYGRTDAPPPVTWLDPVLDVGEKYRCTTAGGRPGFMTMYGKCVSGLTTPDVQVLVIVPADGLPSTSALAHELGHVAKLRARRPLPHHTEGPWLFCDDEKALPPPACVPREREGEFYAAVAAANEALRAKGM